MTGGQAVNPLVEGMRSRDVAKAKIGRERALIEPAGDSRRSEHPLYLAGKDEMIGAGVVIQRLLAHAIAGEGQDLTSLIPDRQCKHPLQQARKPTGWFSLGEVGDHLR